MIIKKLGKKNILLIILISVLVLVIGGTLAYFGWSTSVNQKLDISVSVFSGGGECRKFLTGGDNNRLFVPTSSKEKGRIIKMRAKHYVANSAPITWNMVVNRLNNVGTTTNGLRHESFKYELINQTTGVIYGSGNFANVEDGDTITFTSSELLQSNKDYTFVLYLWIDGVNFENPLDMRNQTVDIDMGCVITGGQENPQNNATPYTDFQYYLGSDSTTIDTIDYYDENTDQNYNVPIDPLTINENEILLVKYNGTDENVSVPSTYTINGTTYNTVILSWIYLYYYDDTTDYEIDSDIGIFLYNTNITSVAIGSNVRFYDDSADSLFCDCTSLVNAPVIPNSVTYMGATFYGCTSLVNAPVIPNSVTYMGTTFSGCTSLLNAPVIPSSVTNMNDTFYGCTSLVNAPVIPSSVTDMTYTFYGCTSLVNAPVIPSSVTDMSGIFSGCTNLTGTVRVNSSNVSYVIDAFAGTSKNITLEVPTGSTTYSRFNVSGAGALPGNVTLTTY